MSEAKAEVKADGGAKPKKKLLMFIIIGVVVLLILVVGGVVGLMMLSKSPDSAEGEPAAEAAHAAPAKKEKKKAETGHGKGPIFEKLPQFTVNLISDNGEIMQTDVALELPDVKVQETVKALMPKIQSAINKSLSSKKPEDVKGAAGRDKLEAEIKELVNKIIDEEGEHGVQSVNFLSLIVR